MSQLKLGRDNTLIKSVVTRSTKRNSVINIYSQFRIIVVRLYMMSNKGYSRTTEHTLSISGNNLVTPVNVRLAVSPFGVWFSGRITITHTIFAESRSVRYVGTLFATIKSLTKKIRVEIELLTASLTFSIFALFGHQSEYNKLIGVNQ